MIPPQVNGATESAILYPTTVEMTEFPMIPPQVNGATRPRYPIYGFKHPVSNDSAPS